MNLYEKYFTKDELRRLPFWQQDARRNSGWAALVAEIQALMAQGAAPDCVEARKLSERWMQMLERDTAANPDFARRITMMMELEPSAQLHTGITPLLKQYIIDAFAEHRLAIYAKYLAPEELRQMRENAGKHGKAWMQLVAAVYQHMEQGVAPSDPAMQALALEWMALFRARIGDHPGTLAKIRIAHEKEPKLLVGTWVTQAMLNYIRQATLPVFLQADG